MNGMLGTVVLLAFIIIAGIGYLIYLLQKETKRLRDSIHETRHTLKKMQETGKISNGCQYRDLDIKRILQKLQNLEEKAGYRAVPNAFQNERKTDYNILEASQPGVINKGELPKQDICYLDHYDTSYTEFYVVSQPTEYRVVKENNEYLLLIDNLLHRNYNDLMILYGRIYDIPQLQKEHPVLKITSHPVLKRTGDDFSVEKHGKISVT
jgi:hypothetical protein